MKNSHKDRGIPVTVFEHIDKLGRMWNDSEETGKIAAEEYLKIEMDVSRRFREMNYLFHGLHLSIHPRINDDENGVVFILVFGRIAGKEVSFKVNAELKQFTKGKPKRLYVLAKPAGHLDNDAYFYSLTYANEVGETLKNILNSTVRVRTAYVRQSTDFIVRHGEAFHVECDDAQFPYRALGIVSGGGRLDGDQEKQLFDFIYTSTSDHWKRLFKPLMNSLLVSHYTKTPDRIYLATS